MKATNWAATAMLALAAASIAVSASVPAAAPATAAAPVPATTQDDAMIALATHSGCLTCHSIKSASASDQSTKPVGPAWQDVAIKYKGQKDAVHVLTSTVMGGSNPYVSHWKGKVSGLAMPPNAVAISRRDARQLVKWILSLDDRGT
ncbi:MAG: c-type cytochrome [Steroidobacteraceae bacterium]